MKHLLIALVSITPCIAQDTSPDTTHHQLKEKAMEKIFSALEPDQVQPALNEARSAGVKQQVLLEAHFLHLVDQENFKAIAAMVPALLKQKDLFNPDESEIFAVKEDWLSIIEYAQALESLQKNDLTNFKKHITEAFWLSPRQGQAFAPHINNLRMQQSMAKITLKLDSPLQLQDSSGNTTLGKILHQKKAGLIYFWSPMSQEVHQNLDDFIATANTCFKHKIAVIPVLVAATPDIRKDAEAIRKEDASKARGTWIIDPKAGALSNILRVTDIPMMVVVSPEGKILFNGHPSNPELWEQLHKIDPAIPLPEHTHQKPHEHVHSDG